MVKIAPSCCGSTSTNGLSTADITWVAMSGCRSTPRTTWLKLWKLAFPVCRRPWSWGYRRLHIWHRKDNWCSHLSRRRKINLLVPVGEPTAMAVPPGPFPARWSFNIGNPTVHLAMNNPTSFGEPRWTCDSLSLLVGKCQSHGSRVVNHGDQIVNTVLAMVINHDEPWNINPCLYLSSIVGQ